jgi:serine/threonine protein phosphatase PrpC
MLNLCPNDRLLLCSDGLWEMVRDPEIERLLRYERNSTRVSDLLVQAALHGGGKDNVSAIVVRVP